LEFQKVELTIKNIGPFRHVSTELSCFNVLVGTNGSGKSLLMKILWSVDSSLMVVTSLTSLMRLLSSAQSLQEASLEELNEGISKLIHELFINKIKGLEMDDFLGSDFEISLRSSVSSVRISRKGAEVEITLPQELQRELENLSNLFKIEPKRLNAFLNFVGTSYALSRLINPCGNIVPKFSRESVLLSGVIVPEAIPTYFPLYIPDSRGGLLRCPVPSKDPIDIYFSFALNLSSVRLRSKSSELPELVWDIIKDLGAENYDFKDGVVKFPWGTVGLSWAPSGLKEVIPLITTLENKMWEVVYLEEPEAHMHPKAIQDVALYVASKAEGKKVLISTHSDYFIYTINDIIASQSLSEEEVKRVWNEKWKWVREARAVNHETSRLLLFKREEKGVEVKTLKPDPTGFDESFLEEVNLELEGRRMRLVSVM
jgi:hypothetical protein